MTDTARNELAHKLGGAFGATAAPALNNPSLNAAPLTATGLNGASIEGAFEPRHAVTTERPGRLPGGEARLGGEPESGIHPAMNPAALSAEPLSGSLGSVGGAGSPASSSHTSSSPVSSSPASSPIDLVLASVIESQVPPGWSAPADELSHHELTVIVRGSLCTIREDGESTSGPVEALMLRPGARREERNAGEVDLHRLRISFHWRNAPAELPEMVQDTCGRLHEIASWLVAERDAQFPNVSEYRQGLLRAMVGEYLRLSVVAASRIEEKTRTYMLRHLGEPITLEDLASNIGMSRYYFCRVYKEVAGHTPMEHLRALRLERAKDLIRSTALPLKAIAPEVGFGSAQHLCRLLHDRFGVGVRELRGAGTLESRGVVSDRGRDSDDVS